MKYPIPPKTPKGPPPLTTGRMSALSPEAWELQLRILPAPLGLPLAAAVQNEKPLLTPYVSVPAPPKK